jgi:hypothetical protein
MRASGGNRLNERVEHVHRRANYASRYVDGDPGPVEGERSAKAKCQN